MTTATHITDHAPHDHREALTLALYLIITAPTDEEASECTAMAESLASAMSAEDIEFAKAAAMLHCDADDAAEEEANRTEVPEAGPVRIACPLCCSKVGHATITALLPDGPFGDASPVEVCPCQDCRDAFLVGRVTITRRRVAELAEIAS